MPCLSPAQTYLLERLAVFQCLRLPQARRMLVRFSLTDPAFHALTRQLHMLGRIRLTGDTICLPGAGICETRLDAVQVLLSLCPDAVDLAVMPAPPYLLCAYSPARDLQLHILPVAVGREKEACFVAQQAPQGSLPSIVILLLTDARQCGALHLSTGCVLAWRDAGGSLQLSKYPVTCKGGTHNV